MQGEDTCRTVAKVVENAGCTDVLYPSRTGVRFLVGVCRLRAWLGAQTQCSCGAFMFLARLAQHIVVICALAYSTD